MGGGASLAGGDEAAIRMNFVEHGTAGVILNTILFNREAFRAFAKFTKGYYSSTCIELYIDIENCKLIDGADAELDFFDALGYIVDRGSKHRDDIPESVQQLCIELKQYAMAHTLTREAATTKLIECQRCIIDQISKWLPFFERSKIFAEYQNYTGKSLFKSFSSELAPLSRIHKKKKLSFTNFLDDSLFPTAHLYHEEDILIMEKVPLLSKILRRCFQPYFRNVSHAMSSAEALELLLSKPFNVVLMNLDMDDHSAIEVIRSYFKMDSYISCLRGRNSMKIRTDLVGQQVAGSTSSITGSSRPVILGMSVQKGLHRQALVEGFKAVLDMPFSMDEFHTARGVMNRHRRLIGSIAALVD